MKPIGPKTIAAIKAGAQDPKFKALAEKSQSFQSMTPDQQHEHKVALLDTVKRLQTNRGFK